MRFTFCIVFYGKLLLYNDLSGYNAESTYPPLLPILSPHSFSVEKPQSQEQR